jgi:3-hydroxyacyl-[acyl-carrier-protein] dehydratase
MVFNTEQIKEILPHRYPFLLIDKIIEFIPEKKAVGVKNVTNTEFFFQGHFPERPVMPGVLIIESMAQVGGIIIMKMNVSNDKLAVLVGTDNVRFRNVVKPGDQMIITSELIYLKSKLGKVISKVEVDNKLVAEGEILFSLVD